MLDRAAVHRVCPSSPALHRDYRSRGYAALILPIGAFQVLDGTQIVAGGIPGAGRTARSPPRICRATTPGAGCGGSPGVPGR
jgi:hypothetical protein